jgi:Uracil DNA glycosylase superfamily
MMSATEGTLWPCDHNELRARFKHAKFFPEEIPNGDQATLLLDLLKLYAEKDLAPAARPLCECCPNKKTCWAGAMDARRTPSRDRPEDGGIILPWVGARYQLGGLVVIAINPNVAQDHRTFLLSEHEISWRDHCVLESGQKNDDDSYFAYRMLRSAAALLDLASELPITDRERPEDLIDALHRTARLQTVKCVPQRDDSEPTSAMGRVCPAFFLDAELEILQPQLILTLGSVPDAAISRLSGYEYLESASVEYLWRHRLIREWGSAEVFAIPHPANRHGGWHRGHEALLAALRRR